MKTSSPMYAGLLKVDGTRFVSCSSLQPVTCPLCSSNDAALLTGNVRFAATMNNEVVTDDEPLGAFVCPRSHVFFLRERDYVALSGESSAFRYDEKSA